MPVYIDERLCKGCGLYTDYCPAKVLSIFGRRNQKGYYVAEVSRPEECKYCLTCEINCPDLAIYVEKDRQRAS